MNQRISGNPWLFVPALYFLEGIPYFIVSTVSVTMFKKMGVSNAEIGLWTSLITWPWVLKMLWGPLVESHSTKRHWIFGTQLLIFVMMLAESFSIVQGSFLNLTLMVLTLMAFLSATHDIAADGFYLLALSDRDQAYFVGIRGTAYRLANIFCNGGLIYLAGRLEMLPDASIPSAWQKVLWIGTALYAVLVLVNYMAMPQPGGDADRRESLPFREAFIEYFSQSRLYIIIAFILFYRFGEAMVVKMSNPFLLDAIARGGLGLSTSDVGFIGGVVGVTALTLGGIIGGMSIARYGLKRCIWPMVLSMNIPIALYVWAAWTQPDKVWANLVVGVDNFGYGFGFAAYMVYLMSVTRNSRYPTANYAISTGLMALGAMLAGIISGYLQEHLGYTGFFVATLLLSIPGMSVLPFLPIESTDQPNVLEKAH
ncbi:MAG: MFS transporter [Candidatus Riflebacteria bacterium]|nr:MFS transporter [Candidatus Riflebacteria bacterium]